MSQSDTTPLTDEERAELEALRAEKARRERAELEELRAERAEASASVQAPSATPAPASQQHAAQPAPRAAATQPVVPAPPEDRTFGQRMVLSDDEDDDGIPTMPPAQKIVIGICLLCAVCLALYVVLSNAGVIG